jgi:hypothetical protein
MKKYLLLTALLIILSGCAFGIYDSRTGFQGAVIGAPYPYRAYSPYGYYAGYPYAYRYGYYPYRASPYYGEPGYYRYGWGRYGQAHP